MSIVDGEQLPYEFLSVEFSDRAVTIHYFDPRLETEYGNKVIQANIRREKFPDEIAELEEDILSLLEAFNDKNNEIPDTRPGRLR